MYFSIFISFNDYFFKRFYFEKKYFENKLKSYYSQYVFNYIFSLFQKNGNLLKVFYLFNQVNYNILNSFSGFNFNNETVEYFNLITFFKFFFLKFKFIFFYFCEKLNKKLYKFANYKLPRYSFKFYYLKPFKRFNKLLKLFSKVDQILNIKGFGKKLYNLNFLFLFNKRNFYILKLINNLQKFIFKNYKFQLFYISKTI